MGNKGSRTSVPGSRRSTEDGSEYDEEEVDSCQMYVTLKLHEVHQLPGGLAPHVYGASPMVGAWDPGRAIAMERESSTMWELSFVVPSDHDTLSFKFLLKPKGVVHPSIQEEGSERELLAGQMNGPAYASFRLGNPGVSPGRGEVDMGNDTGALLEFPVVVLWEAVSPFTLAASYRVHQEALCARGSIVRGIPDVEIDEAGPDEELLRSPKYAEAALTMDLEKYEVPPPPEVKVDSYAADQTEEPRHIQRAVSMPMPMPIKPQHNLQMGRSASTANPEPRGRSVSIKDLVVMGQGSPGELPAFSSVPHDPDPVEAEPGSAGSEGSYAVDAIIPEDGVPGLSFGSPGKSPRLYTSLSERSLQRMEEADLPEAAGAVAAAAAFDRILGPKERRRLAIVLVGLPARGKTFTAAKLTRYLRWLGHDTKHFNVGKYRRLKHGGSQMSDFFRADNKEGVEARNEVAILAMEDMLAWMEEGGQVGVFDATNSTQERRSMLMRMAEGKCKVIFIETICTVQGVIDANIRIKVAKSSDYKSFPDQELALADFKARLTNYEKVYEPVNDGSYIKLIDMVSGNCGQMQVNNISGYLPGRIVFFLLNTHICQRPILLTRHGESLDNVRGRIGGDPALSDAGEEYAIKLANFVEKRLKSEKAASVWTSTLQRTIMTARHIYGYPKVQWRALDEINAGVCDGMTYQEIKDDMPDEYMARKMDKLRYRYPRGESYLDVIQRLEPVIIELERQRAPVLVIAHQAVLRSLYAYFMDKPLKEVPHIEMPLHTIIELTTGVSGINEKRYKLME